MESSLTVVDRSNARKIATSMQRSGWLMFELNTEITSRASFFDAARKRLPLDPPLGDGLKWDALFDSLFEGFRTLPSDQILVLWENAYQLRSAEPREFAVASEGFQELARLLSDPSMTLSAPKQLRFIVGV